MSTASTTRNALPILLALGFAGISFAATRFFSHALAQQSPVDIIPAKVDLGHLGQYAVVDRVVQLSNPSSSPLQVSDVTTSCGCTTTDAPDSIPPHSKAPLTVRFNALSRNGAVQEEVDVTLTNHETVAIPIIGSVMPEIALSQTVLHLTGKRKTASLTLTRIDGKPLSISSVHALGSLTAKVFQVAPQVVRLTAYLNGPGLSGAHDETLIIHLDDLLVPTLNVPVSWTTKSAYKIRPPSVNFGSATPGTALTQKVRISGPDAAHIRLVSAPLGWRAQLQPAARGTVDLTLNGSSKGGPLHSSVVLGTGNVHEPSITIPVYAVFETAASACSSKPLSNNSPRQ